MQSSELWNSIAMDGSMRFYLNSKINNVKFLVLIFDDFLFPLIKNSTDSDGADVPGIYLSCR